MNPKAYVGPQPQEPKQPLFVRAFRGLQDTLNPNKVEYQAPAPSTEQIRTGIARSHGVPAEYAQAFAKSSINTGYSVRNLVAHKNVEGYEGKYDPKLRGKRDPKDLGILQMNPIAADVITGKGKGDRRNRFKEKFGHDFDPNNGQDQILAGGEYLKHLRDFDLPARGIQNPTADQVFVGYNTMNLESPRGRQYLDLLRNRGVTF